MPVDPIIARGMPDLGANALGTIQTNRETRRVQGNLDRQYESQQQQYGLDQKRTVLGVTISRLAGIKDPAQREQAWQQLRAPIEQALTEFTGQPVAGLTMDQALGVASGVLGMKSPEEKQDLSLTEQAGPFGSRIVKGSDGRWQIVQPERSQETLSSEERMWREYQNMTPEQRAVFDSFRGRKQPDDGGLTPAQIESRVTDLDASINALGDAKNLVSPWSTGFLGKFMRNFGGTDATNLAAVLKVVTSNLAFSRLQRMRDESKTGGALGNVSERELDLLMSTIESFDPNQSRDQLLKSINDLTEQYQSALGAYEAAMMEKSQMKGGAQPQQGGGARIRYDEKGQRVQ